MKKILSAILVFAAMTFAAGSSEKSMAVGGWLQAGNPGEHAGLDFMLRQSDMITMDIYAHFFFRTGDNSLGAYFGYYWNFYLKAVPTNLGRMGFYVGPAGGVGWWNEDRWKNKVIPGDETGLSFRVGAVGGYQWEFPIPLQLYLELNPVGELHLLWWDYDDKTEDDDVQWELPDFYFRIGLRFWF